jgi:hypothetical protein
MGRLTIFYNYNGNINNDFICLASFRHFTGRHGTCPFRTCSVPFEELRYGLRFQKLSSKSSNGECRTDEHARSCQGMAQVKKFRHVCVMFC